MRMRTSTYLVVIAAALLASACTSGDSPSGLFGAGESETIATTSGPYCGTTQPDSWLVSQPEVDQIAMIRNDDYPPPPIEGIDRPAGGQASEYPTAQDFLAQANIADKAKRAAVLEEARFKGGIEKDWTGFPQEGNHGVQALHFPNSTSAARYLSVAIQDQCAQGVEARDLSADGGFAFLDARGDGQAWFISGEYFIAISLCSCGEADPFPILEQWYQEWVAQMGGLGPMPIPD